MANAEFSISNIQVGEAAENPLIGLPYAGPSSLGSQRR